MKNQEAMRCLLCPKPRCSDACPVHTPVPECMRYYREDKLEEAGRVLFQNNPMTAVTSQVCDWKKFCYGHCVLNARNVPVRWYEIEQEISEAYLLNHHEKKPEQNGKNAAVIGAGPAGMTAAILLAQKGYAIDLYDDNDRPGGVLRYGIPPFRLDRKYSDAYERILPLNRKSEAYAMLADCPEIRIPEHRMVTNVTQFQEAVEHLKGKWKQVCFKFEQDEGGRSFRLLDETPKGYHALFKKQSATRMNYAAAVEALSEVGSFPPMIVMPYLPDDEISADCLNTQDGLIIIPRIKNPTRTELVRFPEDVLEMCRAFHRRCPLEMPFNIQFKYLEGIPYFLEVNTRMSGGVQMACAAAGVNIPNIAVNKLLGTQKPWNIRTEERFVTHVETPIVF